MNQVHVGKHILKPKTAPCQLFRGLKPEPFISKWRSVNFLLFFAFGYKDLKTIQAIFLDNFLS